MLRRCVSLVVVLAAAPAGAETFQVGPTRAYQELDDVVDLVRPGDVVEIDGGHTYPGGVVFDRAGEPNNKITVRGIRVNGSRPVISGGTNTIEARANHYVFEGLDLTAGTSRCFYHHADDITLRDSIVHYCPAQGILGADSDSGSFTLEYSEVHNCGNGTQQHQIYMSTDASVYPNAVFRMQWNYIHDANGGNNVKSRAARNEVFYNWIEGALYHEVELIGSEANPEALVREDSDVVGNVLMKRNANSFVVRFGGDGTGQTNGRYRFVNNTVIVMPQGGAVFRLFDGIDSLEAHNNAFAVRGSGTVNMVREAEATWVSGSTTIAGQNNWIQSGAQNIPAGFTGTIEGAEPGFTDLANDDLRPVSGSPLVDAGATSLAGPTGHEFPNPLPAPLYLPPGKVAVITGSAEGRNSVGTIDIGAFELGGGGPPPDGGNNGGGDGGTGPGTGDGDDSGCGCALGGGTGGGGASLVMAVALLLRRKRARCRPA
jgi:hypothetical protein